MPLHHDQGTVLADGLVLATLASGSSGNCTFIGDEAGSGVLIDCGISTKQILTRMDAVGLAGHRVDAVFITHEHSDHIGAMGVLDRKLTALQGAPVPFYLTPGTWSRVPDRLRPQRPVLIERGATVHAGRWRATSHPVPHDTPEPVCWTVEAVDGGPRAGVITDLGSTPRHLDLVLASLDVAVLEFNHDPDLLLDGPYPWELKQRIRGRHGHLSNEDAADLLERSWSGRLRHLVLAHLSEENNLPELALRAADVALGRVGARGLQVHLGRRDVPVGPLSAGPPAAAPLLRFA